MRSLLTLIFFFLVSTLSFAQMANRLDRLEVNDMTAKKLDVVSTTSGSKPCPSMSITQRNEIVSPIEGQCIYNNSVKTLNLYDGSSWVEVAGGGGGGINNWQTSFFYDVGAVVIESDKIYQAITQHTSTVFLSDISNWVELANDVSSSVGVLPMSNGGTDKSLTPLLGGLVYTDDLSMEVLPAGTSGQLLKSNGSAAPEWTTLSVDDASFSGVLSMEKGGTNSPLTATPGSVAYSDIDSLELLSPGTPGQVLQTNGSDAPSFVNKSIPGKLGDGSTVVIEELQAPNNQMTQVDTNKHLIESGNKNILQNPSFESLLEGGSIPYWSYGSPSPVQEESSTVIDGKKLAVFSVSSEPILLTQSSTLYANAFADGVQGLVSVRVKSDVALKVCSINAGTTSTSNCVDVLPDNKWGLYKVPTILGATSNGISIASSGNVTGTAYIDDAFVGPQDLKQDVSTCNSIECAESFTFQMNAVGAIASFDYNIFSGSCTKSGTSSSEASCPVTTGVFSEIPKCTCTVNESSTSDQTCTSLNTSTISSIKFKTFSGTSPASLAATVTCTRQGTDFTNAKRLGNNTTYSTASDNFSTDTNALTFKATALTSADPIGTYNTYSYAINSNTKAICGTAPSTLSTKADGFKIFTRAYNAASTCGNPARVEIKIAQAGTSLPTLSKEIYKNTGKGISGSMDYVLHSSNAGAYGASVKSYDGASGVLIVDSGFQPLAAIASSVFIFSDNSGQASGYLVINAGKAKDIIIGQFSGLESCTDSYECTDTFSAKVSSTGVVSGENIDWISGNCSITGTSGATCTYNTNLVTQSMNCVSTSSEWYHTIMATSTSTGFISYSYNNSHAQAAAEQYIICQKQGADYIGKTAKAVASDQNVRSIGAVGVDIQSVYFGSGANCQSACTTGTCNICTQVGTKITSVTWASATGNYNVNGIDGTKYICNGNAYDGAVAGAFSMVHSLGPSTDTYARMYGSRGGTTYNGYGTVTCIGTP
jgi:hypothetical protein